MNQTPAPAEPTENAPPPLPVLREPADGVPAVVASPTALEQAAAAIAAGSGPVAIDAERASGHRYGQRAFLVQLRRTGSGTSLVDPAALSDLQPLARALSGTEWILHASTQDLPCLAELGLRPDALFDTELAARLLGMPRVGLAGLTEDLLGVGLAKGHGAADWSKRPLPAEWLTYAALDVELLIPMRELLWQRLDEAGRRDWAEEEFRYLTTWEPKLRPDPWRRTSGVTKVGDPRSLAVVRELWQTRERLAQGADQPPGRIMKDATLVAIVKAAPRSERELAELPDMRPQRRRVHHWWRAIESALALPEADLPPRHVDDGPPPQRAWERRNPVAAARLTAVRGALTQRAEELGIPTEILISPDPVRSLVWESEGPVSEADVRTQLAAQGVRTWQVDLVAELIAAHLT